MGYSNKQGLAVLGILRVKSMIERPSP